MKNNMKKCLLGVLLGLSVHLVNAYKIEINNKTNQEVRIEIEFGYASVFCRKKEKEFIVQPYASTVFNTGACCLLAPKPSSEGPSAILWLRPKNGPTARVAIPQTGFRTLCRHVTIDFMESEGRYTAREV